MPTVSIVVPAYNPGRLLTRALDSIVAQSFGDWECVVVDDGSDEALAWVAYRDPRIRLLRQANAGVAAARNRGIEATTGRLVAFCDHDDEWLPAKLERQVTSLLARWPVLHIFRTRRLVGEAHREWLRRC